MDNPTTYLRNYLRKHFANFQISPIKTNFGERTAEGWLNARLGTGWWNFKMLIPRSAPENGRPLCTLVKHGGVVVWSFVENHKTFQGVYRKVRVHLHYVSFGNMGRFVLVEVLEGDPDTLTRVYHVDGNEFSQEVEVLLKGEIGRLWGMWVHMSQQEKRVLERLLQPKKKPAAATPSCTLLVS